jgi:hypothetical protein
VCLHLFACAPWCPAKKMLEQKLVELWLGRKCGGTARVLQGCASCDKVRKRETARALCGKSIEAGEGAVKPALDCKRSDGAGQTALCPEPAKNITA